MKVVHIFWGLGFGGIETMLVNIANAQANYGAEIHIILINELYEKSLLDKLSSQVTIHILNRKLGSNSLGFVFRLNRVLKYINPDKLHLHGPEFYAMIFSRKFRRKTSLTLHALPTGSASHGSFWRSLMARLTFGLKFGEELVTSIPKVFAISSSVKDAFYLKYAVNSRVIFNGILTSNFKEKESYEISMPFRLVQIGRLDYENKGQDLLIRAISNLKGKVTVTFIGDGEGKEYLKELSHSLGMDEYVHFLGKKSQEYIASHLRDYDLFVQPSRHEGFGLTVAEAMASKVPVLVSSGQGPAEVTENGTYGWVFENNNDLDLANQIELIFDKYDKAKEKTNLAFNHVVNSYDVSLTAKKYLEFY